MSRPNTKILLVLVIVYQMSRPNTKILLVLVLVYQMSRPNTKILLVLVIVYQNNTTLFSYSNYTDLHINPKATII